MRRLPRDAQTVRIKTDRTGGCYRGRERLTVLGVFYTPGWGAVVMLSGTLGGVMVTQFVNTWNKRIDAKAKREDRQHERALDYEQRVWQAKSDALKRLISVCRFVKVQAQLAGADNTDENHRRAVTIRALDQFRERIGGEDGISEITAYAAEPVRKALDEMLEVVAVQQRQHNGALSELRRVGTQWLALGNEPLIDASGASIGEAQQQLQRRIDLGHERRQAPDHIGTRSDLDVDRVVTLCDRVIDVARKDLQGDCTD